MTNIESDAAWLTHSGWPGQHADTLLDRVQREYPRIFPSDSCRVCHRSIITRVIVLRYLTHLISQITQEGAKRSRTNFVSELLDRSRPVPLLGLSSRKLIDFPYPSMNRFPSGGPTLMSCVSESLANLQDRLPHEAEQAPDYSALRP